MTPTSKNADPFTGNPDVLATWKGIAAYFGCNVRTVKRYEQERGLPVHRAPGKRGSTVYARASELTAWLESRGKQQRLDPAIFTSGTVVDLGPVAQNYSPPADVALAYAAFSDGRPAKQVLFLRWRPWVLMVFALLICSAALFWKVWNHQTAAATIISQSNALKARPHVPAPGAEDLFLRGRYYWNLRTADGLARAIDSYTQAIVTDPSYADAYAGLAESYDLLPQFGQADLGDSLRKAEHAADRAIALDPNLAAAHRAKAFSLFYWDWDVAESETEFRRALALDPGSAQTHQWYAGTLQLRSDGPEAIRQIDEAVRLDPTSPAIAADAALLHADFGDFKAGMKALKEIEQTQPTLASPAQFLRELDFATGDFPAYIDDVRRFASITQAPDDVALAQAVARGWARAGRTGLLEARAEALRGAFDHGTETGFLLGQTLLLLGRRQEALFYFRASLTRHSVRLVGIDDYPWARKLSGDPGYAALFAQIHQRVHKGIPNHPGQAQVAFELPL
jgi:tetratricopeptide (TPR) repeat protein